MTTDQTRILEELRLAFEARPSAALGDILGDAARVGGHYVVMWMADRDLLLGLVQLRQDREASASR